MNISIKLIIGFIMFALGCLLYTTISKSQQSNRAQIVSFECLGTAKSLPQDQRKEYLKICITKKLTE